MTVVLAVSLFTLSSCEDDEKITYCKCSGHPMHLLMLLALTC